MLPSCHHHNDPEIMILQKHGTLTEGTPDTVLGEKFLYGNSNACMLLLVRRQPWAGAYTLQNIASWKTISLMACQETHSNPYIITQILEVPKGEW